MFAVRDDDVHCITNPMPKAARSVSPGSAFRFVNNIPSSTTQDCLEFDVMVNGGFGWTTGFGYIKGSFMAELRPCAPS